MNYLYTACFRDSLDALHMMKFQEHEGDEEAIAVASAAGAQRGMRLVYLVRHNTLQYWMPSMYVADVAPLPQMLCTMEQTQAVLEAQSAISRIMRQTNA